jgi:GNAT superfamily N-acetyltransferase
MKKLKAFFRKPNHKDYKQFLEIYKNFYLNPHLSDKKEYLKKMKNKGLLVGKPLSFQKANKAAFLECALIEDKPVAFIRIDKLSNEMCASRFSLQWFNNSQLWRAFCREDGFELGVVLTKEEYQKKGFAGILLNRGEGFIKKTGGTNLFSWVVSKPLNKPSMAFHKKYGFTKVALYRSQKSFGIENYESVLFWKKV